MTTASSIKNRGLLSFVVFSPFFDRFLSLLGRTILASLLISLILLPGLSINPAIAVPMVAAAMPEANASEIVDSAAKGERISAFIACLPKQLSQPSLERAWEEMGDDQLERIFNFKSNPKLSQAEIELKSCLNRKGFTS
jgi:hypothetical protein